MTLKFDNQLKKQPKVLEAFKTYCNLQGISKERDGGLTTKKRIMSVGLNNSSHEVYEKMEALREKEESCIKDPQCSKELLRKVGLETLVDAGCNFNDVFLVISNVEDENRKTFKTSQDSV